MSGPLLTAASTVQCSDAGVATPLAPFARVLIDGVPIVTVGATYSIAGCALSASGSTPFCVTGQFIAGATRVLAGGTPVATQGGASTCTPTATPMMVVSTQSRVTAI